MSRLSASLLSIAFLAAFAQAPCAAAADATVKQACSHDYKKFCVGSRLRAGGSEKCMRDHASQLSDACKVAWADEHPPSEAGATSSKNAP